MRLRGGMPATEGASLLMAMALLAVSLPLGMEAVALKTSEARHGGSNPVRKVIDMLEAMQKKANEEAEEKEKVYETYKCYCKTNKKTLNDQLAQADQDLPLLRSKIRESASQQATINAEITQHKKDRTDASNTMKNARELRAKEAATYAEEFKTQTEIRDALTEAVHALEQGMKGVFLQTNSAAVLRRLTLSADMTTRSRDVLSSFLAADSGYEPASGEILGVLKGMKDEAATSIKEMAQTEQQRQAEFSNLNDASLKEIDAAMKAIEEKMLRLSELRVEYYDMKSDEEVLEKQTNEAREFLNDLTKSCDEKDKAWVLYSQAQAEEVKAIAETVEFLDSDEARETMMAASKQGSLLQKPSESSLSDPLTSHRPTWLSFMQVASGGRDAEESAAGKAARVLREAKGGDQRLELIELALQGQKGGLQEVITKIEDLLDVLEKEDQADQDKFAYCNSKLRKAKYALEDKEKQIEDAKTIMTTFQNELGTVNEHIKKLEESMKDLDKEVDKATASRKDEHDKFVKERAINNQAVTLLNVAQSRLERHYASFAQVLHNSSQLRTRQVKPKGVTDEPEADLRYRKSQDSLQVFTLFNQIKVDIQQVGARLEAEEKIDQMQYESFVRHSNEKKNEDAKALSNKKASRAELEVSLQQGEQELRSHHEVLAAMKEELAELHADCDFLVANFDLREQARRNERTSLKRAQGLLSDAVASVQFA